MSYYKPTTLLQKVIKVVQLYSYSFLLSFSRKKVRTNQKKIAILMVVSKLDRIGGLERQALELSSALIHQDCLITIVTDRIDDSPASELRAGYMIRRLSRSTETVRLFLSMVWFLFRQRNAFHIVHAHGVTGFTLAWIFLSAFLDRPVLIKGATKADFENIFNQSDLKHRIYRRWILSANGVIAISQQIKEELLSCGVPENRIFRIPNAVHAEKFSPPTAARKILLRKKFSIETDQIVFLYFGRLEARKAVDVLLNAWRLKSRGLLCIVGSGPEQEKWKQLGIDLNLKNIRFFDESRSALEFYQCADVFVLPSLKEGMPGALLEAMSCGLPCIATKIGGVVDVMQDGKQGLLVSPGATEELADALAFIASRPEKRIEWGRAARERAVDQFELSRIAANYKTLYSEIIASHKS